MTLSKIFLLFIIYSVIGWLVELILVYVDEKKLINRGFFVGPYCPIYGFGGLIISFALNKYADSPVTLFVMSMFSCALLEYITSYLLEKLFNARWWDYTHFKYNINGRICLEASLLFGVFGCLMIYFISPFFQDVLDLLSIKFCNILAGFIFIIFTLDAIISLKIMSSFKRTLINIKCKDSTEEITKKVREILLKKSPFTRRLVNAFPNLKAVIVNIKNELLKVKKELKITKKELKNSNNKLKKLEKKVNKCKKD